MSNKTSHYGGRVEILFDNNARNRYVVLKDGESWSPVGVTSVLGRTLNKDGLMLWPLYESHKWLKANWHSVQDADYAMFEALLDKAAKAHTAKSDIGKDAGHEIHRLIEEYLRGQEQPHSELDVANKAYRGFLTWYKAQNIKPLAIERIVYSLEHDFAGTTDAIVELDGKIVLLDWKSTNRGMAAPLGIYDNHFAQLGAYSLAHKEEYGKPIDDLAVVNVSKQGKVAMLKASDLGLSVEECEEAFLHTLKMYRFMVPLAKQLKERKEV